MNPIISVLTSIAPALFNVIDQTITDKDLALRLKNDITVKMLDSNSEVVKSGASVIMAEASGESWLQRNWRPMLMVWFSILIGGYWFGYVPNNMPVEIVAKLFDLVTIGIGGYVGGRSLEKIANTIAPAFTKS